MARAKKQPTEQKVSKPQEFIPSNLSFLRSIEPTEFSMHAVAPVSEDFRGLVSLHERADAPHYRRAPVRVQVETIRGTISHYEHKRTPIERVGTGEKALETPNVQRIEFAKLPANAPYLFVEGEIRFSGHSSRPHMHNSRRFIEQLRVFLEGYGRACGYEELARRYLLQIVNGSWLWRNRLAEDMQTRVHHNGLVLLVHESDLDMRCGFDARALKSQEHRAVFEELAARLAVALNGDESQTVRLDVSGMVRCGSGAEVYPSQEFTSEASERAAARGERPAEKLLSKNWLLGDTEPIATIHARKVNNAVRTIDTWHGVDGVNAIAVEPFGADTFEAQAYRVEGNDLYTHLRNLPRLIETLNDGVNGEHHYLAASLIRGGVYGMKKETAVAAANSGASETGEQSGEGSQGSDESSETETSTLAQPEVTA